MKIYAVIVSLILMVGCVHSSGKSSSVDIEGTWKGEMEGEWQSVQFTFNFRKIGNSMTGSVYDASRQWLPLEDLEIKGNKIRFSVAKENVFGMKTIMKYKGKIKNEKIELSFKVKMKIPDGPRMRSPRPNHSMGDMGGIVDLRMSEMDGGAGFRKSKNKFTVERVALAIEGPVN